jgi:hypothetical protein
VEDLELQALVLVLRSEISASLQVERQARARRHLDLDLPQLRDDLLRTPVLASRHQGLFQLGAALSVNPVKIEPVRSVLQHDCEVQPVITVACRMKVGQVLGIGLQCWGVPRS